MAIRRNLQWFVVFWAILVANPGLAHAQATQTAPSVSVVESRPVRLDAASHSGQGLLRVRSTTSDRILLTLGPLVDLATKEVLPATVIFAEATSKGPDFDPTPNQIHDVTVTVSKVFFEGEAQAPILNRGQKIGDLQITRAPFAVSLVSDQPIEMRHGDRSAIGIRNDSRDVYQLSWMIQIGAEKHCGLKEIGDTDNKETVARNCDDVNDWAKVTVQPKERSVIDVSPPAEWFGSPGPSPLKWLGRFRRRVEDGSLWLALPNDVPKKTLPIKANLSGSLYAELIWIVLLLALGATMSLLVRYWVPNMQRKRDLKDQTRRIRNKIDGISGEIDSTLRALVLVQLNLLDAVRKSIATIFPDYATVANVCAQAATLLERRVEMIEQIDSTYEQAATTWEQSPPPSLVDEVERLLRSAAEVLRKPQPTEADFINAQKFIDQARAINANMGTDDEDFGKKLATRLEAMREELQTLKATDTYASFKQKLPGAFRLVEPPPPGPAPDGQGGEAQPANNGVSRLSVVPNEQRSLVDYDLCALRVVRDFIWLNEGSADPEFREELKKLEPLLVRHLSHKSWNEVRRAGLLLKEFRENSSEEKVRNAIAEGKDQMFVEYEPKGSHVDNGVVTIYARQLVQFRAHFRQSELNWSAARENFSCVWDFGDGHRDERGWVASHFFPDVRVSRRARFWQAIKGWFSKSGSKEESRRWQRYKVRVEFVDKNGAPVSSTVQPLEIEVTRDPSDDRRTRSVAELIGLAVSIAVPFLALISGARDQLAQNPAGAAMTVFLLGYSSESIISVFKQRASPTT